MPTPGDVLRALASLAPGDASDDVVIDVAAQGEPLLWLGATVDVASLFVAPPQDTREQHVDLWAGAPQHPTIPRSKTAKDLHSLDSLHKEERILRLGWLWVCGRVDIDGRTRQLCTPLIARPVRLTSSLASYAVVPVGDAELTVDTNHRTSAIEHPVFYDPGWGDNPSPALLARMPRLRSWVQQVVSAAGLPAVKDYVGGRLRPEELSRRPGLTAVVGAGIYVDRAARPGTRASALRDWAATNGLETTAFAAVYGLASSPRRGAAHLDGEVLQPLPLTHAQQQVVLRCREEQLVCVSGAPGNGKSHLVAALAIDAVSRGESVLVTTPTPYAADVLSELLHRHPGPEPVAFGEGEARSRMAGLLDSLASSTTSDEEVGRRGEVVEARRAAFNRATAEVEHALAREARAERSGQRLSRLADLRAAVPLVFDATTDLAALQSRLDTARHHRRGLRGRWHARRLRNACAVGRSVRLAVVDEALAAARDLRAQAEVEALGGTRIGLAWEALFDAEVELRRAEGSLVDALARRQSRWGGGGRRAVAALKRALPAARRTRRDLLADLDADDLVRALPLWIGTLRDVEDLLPARPSCFDLVIVDEAAQVDQFRGAGALLRARRAVIVGDPRQLRHVSFVADVDVSAAVEAVGLGALADRLDVRRLSLFDLAAGATAVTWLDEHFRSVPHLIEFSSKRFYEGRVLVATRHPCNESTDAIETIRVEGTPADEVGAALAVVERLAAGDRRSIATVSPFRAQADALEQALLARYEPEEIEALDLRVGTAHSFQGSECDHVVVSLALASTDARRRWRFVEDPNLFNVLVTRARRSVTVVTSLSPGTEGRGVVAAYLRHADRPPAAPTSDTQSSPWVDALGVELGRHGLAVRAGYPVGRWLADLCVGDGSDAAAIDCVPHADGAAAHIARRHALRLAGWRIVEAFPTCWDGDAVRAAIEVAGLVRSGGSDRSL